MSIRDTGLCGVTCLVNTALGRVRVLFLLGSSELVIGVLSFFMVFLSLVSSQSGVIKIFISNPLISVLFKYLAHRHQVANILLSNLQLIKKVIDKLRIAVFSNSLHVRQFALLYIRKFFTDAVNVTDS